MTKLSVHNQADVTVLEFSGPMLQADVDRIEPQFRKVALGTARRLVIDLSKVEILATSAITMFLTAMSEQRKHGGRVIFTGTQGAIDKLLHLCRLDLIMTIIPDPVTAVAQAAR